MVYIPLYASGEKETRKLYFFLLEAFFLASNIVQYTWCIQNQSEKSK